MRIKSVSYRSKSSSYFPEGDSYRSPGSANVSSASFCATLGHVGDYFLGRASDVATRRYLAEAGTRRPSPRHNVASTHFVILESFFGESVTFSGRGVTFNLFVPDIGFHPFEMKSDRFADRFLDFFNRCPDGNTAR